MLPSPSQDMQIEIVHLFAFARGTQCVVQLLAAGLGNQLLERQSEQIPLLVSHIKPAPVGVANHAGRVYNQNQTLRVIENFAGEIALSLQFRLESFDSADIENEAAVLNNPAEGIAHSKTIDQYVDAAAPSLRVKVSS